MEKIKYISFEKIEKIEIYENKSKLTLKQIIKEKSPDYAITGNFYLSSWKPTCHLKKDGKILASDEYIYDGFAWNSPNDFKMCHVPTDSIEYENHYACRTLVAYGQPISDENLRYNKDVGGTRGRTAIGIKDNSLVLYASKDGTVDAKTPENLRNYLYALGLKDAIMGDGGSKVNFYDGDFMQGSAKSQNLILVYLKKDSNTNIDNHTHIISNILNNNPRQQAHQSKNKSGYMQHSTATPGAKASTFIKSWNNANCKAETEFVIDDTGIYQCLDIGIRTWHCGGSGNNTHVGCEVCEPIETRVLDVNWKNLSKGSSNNTIYAVTLVQEELTARGYNVNGIDGVFGSGLEKAVKEFQKDSGLNADGIVGKGTLHKLQNRENSYLKYNPDKTKDYFKNVYNKSVYTCAWVLNKLNTKDINSNTVLSHAEGYKKRIASNHADVGHWWPLHGKTMDDFRKDVIIYNNTGVLPFENETGNNNEFEKAWDLCCDKGIFDGTNPKGNVTREQLAVILVRTGVVKE